MHAASFGERTYHPYRSGQVINLEEIAALKEQAHQFLSFLDCFNDRNNPGPTPQIAMAVRNAKEKLETGKSNYQTSINNIDSHYQEMLKAQEEIKNQAVKSTKESLEEKSIYEKRMKDLEDSRTQLISEMGAPLEINKNPRAREIFQKIYDIDELLKVELLNLINARNKCFMYEKSVQVKQSASDCQKLKIEQERQKNLAERAYYMKILETKGEIKEALK